jgi:glycosyltransferase involved in cell wall biosynthesis
MNDFSTSHSDGRPARRILIIAEAFGGGMFEITRIQAEGLVRLGYNVAIAYGRRLETPENVRANVDESVELIPLPWSDRSPVSQLRAHRALRRVIGDWKPDIMHMMSSFAGVHGVLVNTPVPKVYTAQAYSFTMRDRSAVVRWAYLIVESFVAARVSVIGACSLSEGEHARSLPGSREVVVVPNGIDELNPTHSHRNHSSHASPQVVGVGRPLPQRQPEACARILSAVADQAEVKWLGGGASDTPGFRALADAGVAMSGWLPRADTLRELAKSTIYLHWTAWDGLSLSLLEAISLDVIVVAHDIGPSREVLGPRQVCRTEGEAIEMIRAILSSPDLRESLLADQRQRGTHYGSEATVRRWSETYESLLDQAAPLRNLQVAKSSARSRSNKPSLAAVRKYRQRVRGSTG